MSLHTDVQGPVTVLRLDAGENRFNPTSLDALEAALDALEAAEGPRAAVLTGTGKYFSNGLDLDWMAQAAEGEPQQVVSRVQELLARLLLAPFPTVGALNGHTFAAGAMLALALDERVMRADRGWFCLPEVDIHIPFTPGMSALITARLSPQAAHRTMTSGARLTGEEALALGVVDALAGEDAVLPDAIARAAALAPKAGATLGAIKAGLYAGPAGALRGPVEGFAT